MSTKVAKKVVSVTRVVAMVAVLSAENCLAVEVASVVQRAYKNLKTTLTESNGSMTLSSSMAPTKESGGFSGAYSTVYSRDLSDNGRMDLSSKWTYIRASGGDEPAHEWNNMAISYTRSKLDISALSRRGIDTSADATVQVEGNGVQYGANQKGSAAISATMTKGILAARPHYALIHNDSELPGANTSSYGIVMYSTYSLAEKWNLDVAWLDYDAVTKKDQGEATALRSTAKLTYSTQWSKSVNFKSMVGTTLVEEDEDGKFSMDNLKERMAYGIGLSLTVF